MLMSSMYGATSDPMSRARRKQPPSEPIVQVARIAQPDWDQTPAKWGVLIIVALLVVGVFFS